MYMIDERSSRVIRMSDGKIVSPAQSADDVHLIEYNNWILAGNSPVIIQVETQSISRKITKLAFTNRLTIQEKIAIEIASIDDRDAVQEVRQFAAMLRVFLEDIDRASFIDLDDANLFGALTLLTTYGILEPQRPSEIINSIITDIERMEQ